MPPPIFMDLNKTKKNSLCREFDKNSRSESEAEGGFYEIAEDAEAVGVGTTI